MENTNKKRSVHHIMAKAVWGTNHEHNKIDLKQLPHRSLHNLFWIKPPHEQISTIIDITWKAFNKVFVDDLQDFLLSKDVEEIYNQKCVNMNKLIQHILETKSW